jgi:hypothetical protein
MALYPFLLSAHYWMSRIGFAMALLMFLVAVYIGLIRHGDVTPAFRRATYAVVAFVGLQFLAGLAMYIIGGRPGEEVHLIYGLGAVLALPFFIYVETTARKRPAMGSYLWGFGLLAAIFIRAMMTGPK